MGTVTLYWPDGSTWRRHDFAALVAPRYIMTLANPEPCARSQDARRRCTCWVQAHFELFDCLDLENPIFEHDGQSYLPDDPGDMTWLLESGWTLIPPPSHDDHL